MSTSPAPERSRLALLVLALLLCWVIRTSNYSIPDVFGPRSALAEHALIAAVCVAFVGVWVNHGLIPATLAAVVLLCVDEPTPDDTLTKRWLFDEVLFIAALGMVILAWSELGRQRFAPVFWLLAWLGGFVVIGAVFVNATRTSDLLIDGAAAGPAKVSLQRAQQLTLGLYVAGGLLGVWQAYRRRTCPRSAVAAAVAVSLSAPALAFGAARLVVKSTLGDFLNGADWASFPGEFWAWAGRGGYGTEIGKSFRGPLGPLVLPLMVVGLWRAVARGYRQKRRGQISLAWPVAFGTGAALLLVPLTVPATRSLTLAFSVGVLSVFGVSDLLQVVADRLILRGPDDQR